MSKTAVVYWSGTGNTEAMALLIADGAREAGSETVIYTAGKFSAALADTYDKIAFGCPSMGAEELEDTEFEPLFSSLDSVLPGKTIALFGSYGWGDGQWMRDWQERCKTDGLKVFNDEGLIVCNAPEGDDVARCRDFGKAFANS